MKKPATEDLEAFLGRQAPEDLVSVLLELANDYEAVQARLARMQLADRPDQLATGFRKRLAGWKRSTRFHGYAEAREFGRMLEGWLEQVARELLPKDPQAALALFEAFIEADEKWFERADDSDSAIGDAVRAACRHWLEAAARCSISPDVWPERLLKLYESDNYGAREELLRRADRLFDERALRGLVAWFESRLAQVAEASPRGENLSLDVFHASAALSLLAESMRDPDIKVRAVLRYTPNPNPVQRQDFVRAYLDADRPADALPWLRDSWDHLDNSPRPSRSRSPIPRASMVTVTIALSLSPRCCSSRRAHAQKRSYTGRCCRPSSNGQTPASMGMRLVTGLDFAISPSTLPACCLCKRTRTLRPGSVRATDARQRSGRV
jgi:hypothetical protein